MIDLEAIAKVVGGELVSALDGFIQGEIDDLKSWGEALAKDAIRAVKDGRPEILLEVKEQAKLIAEIERIRISGFTWTQVANVAISLAKVAITFIP